MRLTFIEAGKRVSMNISWHGARRVVQARIDLTYKLPKLPQFSLNVLPGVSKAESLRERKYYQSVRKKVINFLGGTCVKCGENDIRVLQINHLDGGGKVETQQGRHFLLRILDGRRSIQDLDIRCANCNLLYEFEVGRRQWLA